VFERKILRKIFGPTKEANGIWRIETNKELGELNKHRNVINYVKAQRLSWFGHTNRTPETSIVKRIHKWKPFTGRPVERPKSRWDNDVRNDLKKMKLVKCAEQVQDRSKWKAIVGKAKTLSELWRHRRRRYIYSCYKFCNQLYVIMVRFSCAQYLIRLLLYVYFICDLVLVVTRAGIINLIGLQCSSRVLCCLN